MPEASKLEFGNQEHIKLAEKGVMCMCGHAKAEHGDYGCHANLTEEVDCECSECGDWHSYRPECECDEFEINN